MSNDKETEDYFKIKKVGCIGAGYVGGSTMSVFSDKCRDVKFIVYDINKTRIKEWNSKELPIYEPGLDDIVQNRRGKNLFFTAKFSDIVDVDMIFLSVNTPTKQSGFGKGKAANLEYLEKCAREIKQKITSGGDKIIVEKSTVPIRTAECIRTILSEGPENKKVKFHILSNPEFLAEGTAVRDLVDPSRVLIGGENMKSINSLAKLYEYWIKPEKIIKTNLWSSELTKLVSNTFLAQRISSINGISALCEITGANVKEVSKAVGADKRIGKYFLNPSVGFGGSCFQKDILNLVYLCEYYGLKEVAEYFMGVIKINNFQKKRFAKRIIRNLFSTVSNKPLTMFGFAFKKNTGDTRESASIYIGKYLLNEKAYVRIYDPKVKKKQIFMDLKAIMNGTYHYDPIKMIANEKKTNEIVEKNVKIFQDPYEAVKGSHAILILTEWDEFKEYDYEKMYKLMKKPAWIFDGRLLLDQKKMEKIGFKVYQIGKPFQDQF